MIKVHFVFFALFCTLYLNSQAQTTYPPGIEGDTAHAPFYHGVASGDPLTDRVILWTRITPPATPSGPLAVDWEVAGDSVFGSIINLGTFVTDSLRDWTVKVDVNGLQPGLVYYYRFKDSNGNVSATGRTKTAPNFPVSRLRFAQVSCSSVWSGYFNAYRRIGERENLDLVVHVGDYVYDNADPDELVRIPNPPLAVPSNLETWRDLHEYYCLDTDFRFAKQMHPFAILWDNHDLSGDSLSRAAAIQAFLEWTPVRQPDSLDPSRLYRTLHYGPLCDLIFMDCYVYRNTDTLPNGESVFIGNDQFAWLSNELSASTAKWKLLANQDMFAQFSLASLPGWLSFGDGPVLDSSAWDGYGGERKRILDHIESNSIHNVMVLSGDAHIPFAADLDQDPFSAASYDETTGQGSVAVEFLAGSISRGNIDEMGFGFAVPIIASVTENDNPHHLFTDFTQHGYGIIDMKPDSAIAEFWFSEILVQTAAEDFGGGWVLRDGEDHWSRTPTTIPSDSVMGTVKAENASEGLFLSVYPNPSDGAGLYAVLESRVAFEGHLEVYDIWGRKLLEVPAALAPSVRKVVSLSGTDNLPSGIYLLRAGERGVLFEVDR